MKLLIVAQKLDKSDDNLGMFHRWCEEFSRNADEVVVLANAVGDVDLPSNVEYHSLGKEQGVGHARRIWRFWELFSHYYARTDMTFFHMAPEYVLAGAPFLIALRRSTGLWYVHKSVTRKLKVAERLVGHIFTVSNLSFRLPSKKVVYTGHAIDTNEFRPAAGNGLPNASLRLIVSGRIAPVKDLETIIKACALLKDVDYHWSLTIVGGPIMRRDSEYLETLKRLVVEKNLEDRVIFSGAKPYLSMSEIYRNHDMFLSMSNTGGIDKVVLEAMASGLTIITANEVFRDALPQKYFLEHRTAKFLAARIKSLAAEDRPNRALRDIVVNQHNLERTIAKIYSTLRGDVRDQLE